METTWLKTRPVGTNVRRRVRRLQLQSCIIHPYVRAANIEGDTKKLNGTEYERTALIVSNGHGEDSMGVLLAQALTAAWPGLHVDAFPVVGDGKAYTRAGVRTVGTQKSMPSGGFMRQGLQPLAADLRAGFIALTRQQINDLKQLSNSYDWAVAMGDIFPLWLCGRHLRRPFIFFPTAKSDYIRPHLPLEVRWMRRWPAAVFARDAKTAQGLREKGVAAQYLGNMMMDALPTSDEPLPGQGPLVALLPGSREEAYHNMELLLAAVALLQPDFRYAVALAGELQEETLVARAAAWGWNGQAVTGADNHGCVGVLSRGDHKVRLYKGRFADILHEATVVLGMAGTANEQAVGLGKPVVTCPGPGPQFTVRFVQAQRKLLGESVLVTEPAAQALADGVTRVLTDSALYDRMAQTGRFRMGEPGGAQRIAEFCNNFAPLQQARRPTTTATSATERCR